MANSAIDPAAHGVETLENVWIPLPGGQRMAARVWLPPGARDGSRPAPAVFEYLPYRKRDLTRVRDDLTHGWFAAHGLCAVRVDMRGSGESDGVLTDQYREQELRDGEAAIRWIAAQPWCDGRVGMMGISPYRPLFSGRAVDTYGRIHRTRDLVLVDPRGTGRSRPRTSGASPTAAATCWS
ncbi:MAG TPA: CocE/NonD family hydrolase [Polyangiaceae bacterium LLY-WYZ-14_1]|nr:CocE/NonD family hydrolase [Polyangiaceae bacterium LLY-WYZ-14_1]